jgi:hypothetical protein
VPRAATAGGRPGRAELSHARHAGSGADPYGGAVAAAIGGTDVGTSDRAGVVLVSVGLVAVQLYCWWGWVYGFAGDVSAGQARR